MARERPNGIVSSSAMRRELTVVFILGILCLAPFLALGGLNEELQMTHRGSISSLPNQKLGWNITDVGDLNGDEKVDYAVGAPGYNSNQGRVYVFLGPLTTVNPNSADWKISGPSSSSFGWSVSGMKSYDGDIYDELIVGAPGNGRAYLFSGRSSGSPTTYANADLVFNGTPAEKFGHSVAGLDFSTDGSGIVMAVGAPLNEHEDSQAQQVITGSVFVYNMTFILDNSLSLVEKEDSALSFKGDTDNGWFGFTVENVGHLNNDEIDDIAIGDPYYDDERGAVYIQYGRDVQELFPGPHAPGMDGYVKGKNDTRLGWSIDGGSDVGSCALDDMVIGAPFGTTGEAYLFYGTLGIIQADLEAATGPTHVEFVGENGGDRFGWSVTLNVTLSAPVGINITNAIAVGAPGLENTTGPTNITNVGGVYIFWDLSIFVIDLSLGATADSRYLGLTQDDNLGYSVLPAMLDTHEGRLMTVSPYFGNTNYGELYLFKRNMYPSLKLPGNFYEPSRGNLQTEFTLRVNYTDNDGDMPRYIDIDLYGIGDVDPIRTISVPLTNPIGENVLKGFVYEIDVNLPNSIAWDDPDAKLKFIARTEAVRGSVGPIITPRRLGPIVDGRIPSPVVESGAGDPPGDDKEKLEGAFKVYWEWPGEDYYPERSHPNTQGEVTKLYLKVRREEQITEANWDDPATVPMKTFYGGEIKIPFDLGEYLLKDLEKKTNYYYAFRAEDEVGNLGAISSPKNYTSWYTRPDIPPSIDGVYLDDYKGPDGEGDDGGVLNISWDPSPTIDTVEYWIFLDTDPFDSIMLAPGEFWDPGDLVVNKYDDSDAFDNTTMLLDHYFDRDGNRKDLIDGTEYFAAVVAVNWEGGFDHKVAISDGAVVINDNEEAITRITGFTGEDTPDDDGTSVTLSWNPTGDPRFKAYHIYGQQNYAFASVDDAVLLADITDRQTSSLVVDNLNDIEVHPGTEYFFAILVEDHNYHIMKDEEGNYLLDDNNSVGGVLALNQEDKNPIIPQIGGIILVDVPSDGGGALQVSWRQAIGKEDFWLYKVYFDDELITDVSSMEAVVSIRERNKNNYEVNEFNGKPLVDGKEYYTVVTIVDYNMNENLDIVNETGGNLGGPTKPINQSDYTRPPKVKWIHVKENSMVKNEKNQKWNVTIEWTPILWVEVKDFNRYLLRWSGKGSYWTREISDIGQGSYTITGLERGSEYWYNISVIDDNGNVGPATPSQNFTTGGQNQPPHSVTVFVKYFVGEKRYVTQLNDTEEMEIEFMKGLEIILRAEAEDDYTLAKRLKYRWWMTIPSGQVINSEQYDPSIQIPEEGDYQIAVMAVDEEGLWSRNNTMIIHIVPPDEEGQGVEVILFAILGVIVLIIPIVIYFVIKSGKRSKEKEMLAEYEERKKKIEAMEPIYTNLPMWTCSCGITQVQITDSAHCNACYESFEGVPVDGIDDYLKDHELVLKEMRIEIPPGWQGQDLAIENAEKDLEERGKQALKGLDEEYASILEKDEEVETEGAEPQQGEPMPLVHHGAVIPGQAPPPTSIPPGAPVVGGAPMAPPPRPGMLVTRPPPMMGQVPIVQQVQRPGMVTGQQPGMPRPPMAPGQQPGMRRPPMKPPQA